MMQNGLGESFWDTQNVEIEGRSIFEKIKLSGKIVPREKDHMFDALGSFSLAFHGGTPQKSQQKS